MSSKGKQPATDYQISSFPNHSRKVINDYEVQTRTKNPISSTTKITSSNHFGKDGGAKKLVIRGLSGRKNTVALPENYEKESLMELRAAIQAVHSSKPASKNLEELYRMVEALCTAQKGHEVYTMVSTELDSHIRSVGEGLVKDSVVQATTLATIDRCWMTHTNHMVLINSIFLCLDRKYVLSTSNVTSLWELGLSMFREQVANQTIVRDRTIAALIKLINNERNGQNVDRSSIRDVCDMLSALSIYSTFLNPFLEASKEYYCGEGNKLVNELDVSEYLHHVNKRIRQEGERVKKYLHIDTLRPLQAIVKHELLKEHIPTLLEKGFENLVMNNKLDELKLMYKLFSMVDGLEELKGHYLRYLKMACSRIVMDAERDNYMVEDLLAFRTTMNKVLEHSFSNQEKLRNACKDAFEATINSRPNKPAELVAKFIDHKLRAGYKTTTEEQLDELLDDVLALFRLIHGKDVFEAFYKKDLSRRLLINRSASVDAERSMLSKLKQECGARFTQNLEGMFKDIDISKDIMYSYNKRKNKTNVDLDVTILTEGQWPTYPNSEGIIIPKELQDQLEPFKLFYLEKHKGRVLQWCPLVGHCIMKANIKDPKDLSISMYQAFVLLEFNKHKSLTLTELRTNTGMETVELKRTLQSLACGKLGTRILLKSPKSKEVMDDDVFSVNMDLENKAKKVKINQIQLKETIEENTATQEQVFQDRQYQVDACVVRIMKTRKTLSHTLLIAGLFEALKFPIKPSDLKKRIESLIDREYLERDEHDTTTYHYLA
eukprot:CFRG5367T1